MSQYYRRSMLIALVATVTALSVLAAPQVWGPVLANVTPTTAQIVWRDLENPARGVLFNGTLMAGSAHEGYRLVTLHGLHPDTAYSYTMDYGNTREGFRFWTAAGVPTTFTFVAHGDTRSDHRVHQAIARAIRKLDPRFVINTGDLVEHGEVPKDWDAFFSSAATLTGNAVYLAAAGNHEENAETFFRLFPGPHTDDTRNIAPYVYDYNQVRIIVLDSNRDLEAQRDWLDRYLTEHHGEATWTVVAFHHPPYSSSSRNGNKYTRTLWAPVLEKHKVDVVFLGHDHFYERSVKDGVQYIITGGGGAPEYPPNAVKNSYQKAVEKTYHFMRVDVTPTIMRIRMIKIDGHIGDDVILTKQR